MRFFLLSAIILLPAIVFADYEPLVNIPLLGSEGNARDLGEYVNAIYAISISIAALLAVIKIVIAGVKWMTTDIVTSKGDAKKDIQGALLGLLVIVGAVIIISIINPQIADVDFTFNEIEGTRSETPTTLSEQWQLEVETCEEFGGCTVLACDGSEVLGYDCDRAENICRDNGSGVRESETGIESSVLCIGYTVNSIVDLETNSGEAMVRTYIIENGDFPNDSNYEIYAINTRLQETGEEVGTITQDMINQWEFTDCPDSGGIYEEISDDSLEITVRVCIR